LAGIPAADDNPVSRLHLPADERGDMRQPVLSAKGARGQRQPVRGAVMRYVRPKSLTWWAGLFSLSVGIAALAIPDSYQVTQLGALVSILAGGGDASPAGLIALGLGLIGLRDVAERAFQGADNAD
jgi:hypothetical protein